MCDCNNENIFLPEVCDIVEATMITASPFDMMEEQRAREMEELTEEPTQIFFTADEGDCLPASPIAPNTRKLSTKRVTKNPSTINPQF